VSTRPCRALLLAAALALAAPAAAQAAKFPAGDCPRYGDLRVCTAQVPSFDGSPLDADLTLPAGKAPGGSGHPLVVLLHGFGGDKHDWQSTDDEADGKDKWHWNSHWFAKRGYYVLSYTARGFRTDPASQPWQPATPAGSSASLPSGTIQLKSRDAEIRDTQWLAALAAATFPDLDRERVVVSGGSYGGGESWLQSTQPEWTFPHTIDPALPVLQLKVAVPKYGWTDLAYSLAPHGRGDPYTAAAGRAGEQPLGVVKLSYVNGFYALGTTDGIFEAGTRTAPTAAGEGAISVPAWRARLADAGDPYDAAGQEDPVVAQARRGLTEFRSSHYQDRPAGRRVAVFSIQGWTDDLFPAVESTREFLALKALDPRWPVSLAFADVGHPRAQNKAATWQWLNAQANSFLSANLDRAREGGSTVTSEATTCDGSTGARVSAADPRALATRTAHFRLPGGSLPPGSGSGDPDGAATDPVAGSLGGNRQETCRTSQAATWPGRYTALTEPLAARLDAVGPGEVRIPYTLAPPVTATVVARVWDVAPDGVARLVTRGAARLDPPAYDGPAGELRLGLFGNHWRVPAGHRLRLDLAQVDEPTFRRSNLETSISFSGAELVLPAR
jgi:predicted acyl esterase